jgi:hypothetical protein
MRTGKLDFQSLGEKKMITERIQDEDIHCIPFIPYASLNVSFGCLQVLRHPPSCTILIEMGLISEFFVLMELNY